MSKYAKLGSYLRAQPGDAVEMTFAEVERVIGSRLPPSALRHRGWWSNNTENNVATKEWVDAGYATEDVDLRGQAVRFRRVQRGNLVEQAGGGGHESTAESATRLAEGASAWAVASTQAGVGPGSEPDRPVRHPLFGAHRGMIWIAPGTDLTQPADPVWSKE